MVRHVVSFSRLNVGGVNRILFGGDFLGMMSSAGAEVCCLGGGDGVGPASPA